MNGPRQLLTYAILATFLLFFFASGVHYQLFRPNIKIFGANSEVHPDFSRFFALKTLPSKDFPLDDSDRRVIILGDVHGNDKPLHTLLKKLSYDPKLDVLVHVGDIVAKGGHDGSMAVLSFMSTNNITGVRGNHDQKVIEWRTWLNWAWSREDRNRWLDQMHTNWVAAKDRGMTLDAWIDHERKVDKTSWWKKVPEGWKLFGEHYKIAHDMSKSEYDYLLSLPLSLHIPSAHTFIGHAGLLSSDPHRGSTHPRQPLSHIPIVPVPDKARLNDTIPVMRRLQEMSILNDVPQNSQPWVLLNMRSISKKHNVSRKNKGTPWSELWNADMERCDGFFYLTPMERTSKPDPLPCYPSSVLYGHAATRGLDVKRWTVGLDSGCVYGKRLTALVLGPQPHLPAIQQTDDVDNTLQSVIPYGDDGRGHLVSVKC